MTITIYHNPACGTSRNTLAMIRQSGEEPRVIEYLKTPPTRDELVALIATMGITPRQLLRQQGTPYDELGLADMSLDDDAIIAAMLSHPILINRPIVVTPLGARLAFGPAVVHTNEARALRFLRPPLSRLHATLPTTSWPRAGGACLRHDGGHPGPTSRYRPFCSGWPGRARP